MRLARTVPVPVMRRVHLPTALAVEATKQAEIDAVDPLNGELSFFLICRGINSLPTDQPNMLLLEGVKPGVHEVVVGAITDRNVIALWHGQLSVDREVE